jgi:hypothetical protein
MEPIDEPQTKAELTAMFEAYERALIQNDIEALNGLFWNDVRTVRYGTRVFELQYGHQEIADFRIRRGAINQARKLSNQHVTTFGKDFGVTTTEFRAAGSTKVGRQSQTWIRTSKGWKIASAHVSYGMD